MISYQILFILEGTIVFFYVRLILKQQYIRKLIIKSRIRTENIILFKFPPLNAFIAWPELIAEVKTRV